MQWSDVTAAPPSRVLRQFAVLCCVVALVIAGRRAWHGQVDLWTWAIVGTGMAIALAGLLRPMLVRGVYTAAMIVAFPIGWTVTRVILMAVFYLMFTPLALVFRLMGRDELQLKRPAGDRESYWERRRPAPAARDYFRQF